MISKKKKTVEERIGNILCDYDALIEQISTKTPIDHYDYPEAKDYLEGRLREVERELRELYQYATVHNNNAEAGYFYDECAKRA